MFTAIIGANYGDEGKGLATNYFTREGKNLVVRHNGGAQSGHTVELVDGKRFVFHELGSGSFNHADTFWDITYHPDLYVLSKEYFEFQRLTGISPVIYSARDTKVTIIDDVLLNHFKETFSKAGSCGMGIWECVCRNNAGYGLTIGEVKNSTFEDLLRKFRLIRAKYTIPRYRKYEEEFNSSIIPMGLQNFKKFSMFEDDNVLYNYVREIKTNVDNLVVIVDNLGSIIDNYDNVVFETGQGLLLDGDYDIEHGTPSKTGLFNITKQLKALGKNLDNAVYITRTYLTRHGRGDFVSKDCKIVGFTDTTNVYNEWQEGLRYGKFNAKSLAELELRIKRDCEGQPFQPSILVTHANETYGKFMTNDGYVNLDILNFNKIYVSSNPYSISDKILKYN